MLVLPDHLETSAVREATYVAAALWALAREERAGRRPRRLLEEGHATWARFRGRMGPRELVELLLEDAAVTQPEPFAMHVLLGPADQDLARIPEGLLGDWLGAVPNVSLDSPVRDYLEEQARALGVTPRPAYSELPKVQPQHRVLELPGTGGRLAAHLVAAQPDVSLKEAFFIACGSWQDRMLAGLAAVALGVVGDPQLAVDPELVAARRVEPAFTHVVGLRPDKGGRFDAHQLEGWFPSAQITLV